MKEIQLPYATIRYDAPIVLIIFNEEVNLGFPEMRELTSKAESLTGKKNYVVLADVRENIHVTYEGKKVSANPREQPYQRGVAVLIKNNELLKTPADFFSPFTHNLPYPYRVFTSQQDAIAWLLSLPLD